MGTCLHDCPVVPVRGLPAPLCLNEGLPVPLCPSEGLPAPLCPSEGAPCSSAVSRARKSSDHTPRSGTSHLPLAPTSSFQGNTLLPTDRGSRQEGPKLYIFLFPNMALPGWASCGEREQAGTASRCRSGGASGSRWVRCRR